MWIATYDDETELRQFDNEGENLFSQIDQDKLSIFTVDCGNHCVALDIESGRVDIDGVVLSFGFEELPKRLIYFRRNKKILGGDSNIPPIEFIGWQSTFEGKNIKRMIFINPLNHNVGVISE